MLHSPLGAWCLLSLSPEPETGEDACLAVLVAQVHRPSGQAWIHTLAQHDWVPGEAVLSSVKGGPQE